MNQKLSPRTEHRNRLRASLPSERLLRARTEQLRTAQRENALLSLKIQRLQEKLAEQVDCRKCHLFEVETGNPLPIDLKILDEPSMIRAVNLAGINAKEAVEVLWTKLNRLQRSNLGSWFQLAKVNCDQLWYKESREAVEESLREDAVQIEKRRQQAAFRKAQEKAAATAEGSLAEKSIMEIFG